MDAEKSEEPAAAPAVDMELEAAGSTPEGGAAAGSTAVVNGVHEPGENGVGKRGREDAGEDEDEDEDEDGVKRQRVERSVEEERLEIMEEGEKGEKGEKGEAAEEGVEEGEKGEGTEHGAEEGEKDEGGDGKEVEEGEKVDGGDGKQVDGDAVKLGPKSFGSSVGMFEYFYKLLHTWSPNLDINRYEFMALMDLIKKGHPEPDKKMGGGIQAFQIRYHPLWKSRCFFLVRVDGTSDDFSFRKCVDHILPLPDNMKAPDGKQSRSNQKGGGRFSGGRGGRGRGRGHGGRGKRGGFAK